MKHNVLEAIAGQRQLPFIIAEMSGNHNQSLNQALAIVDAAAEAGADALKLQTYTADTMTLNVDKPGFRITDENNPWTGRHLYELYHEAHTPWDWHPAIMDRAKQKGMICFSTPFDPTAVDFLESLNVPFYKIASFENTDVKLLEKVAQTGKPVIVSTGMATLEDIELIVTTLRGQGCHQLVLLKCTSAYPASPSDAHLNTIPDMAKRFDCEVGLSDHTLGVGVPIASVALGASVIEKHFCLARSDGGVDASFSLEPHELKTLVEESKKAHQALGQPHYNVASAKESASKQFKRSLYFARALQPGDVITDDCIRSVRPGYGLEPKYWGHVVGQTVQMEVEPGDPVSWEQMMQENEV